MKNEPTALSIEQGNKPLSDKQWQKIIQKSVDLLGEAFRLRELAENEYERRFGKNPSDWDDDWWIDTVHYGGNANVDVKALIKSALLTKSIYETKMGNDKSKQQ